MAKVKALYSYTYDYEGSKITFKSGEEFQLLAKANNDWWHVRRWIAEGSQDLYVPAVYMKEVGAGGDDPLYENVEDVAKQLIAFKENESSTRPPTMQKQVKDSGKEDLTEPIFVSTSEDFEQKKKLMESFQVKPNDEIATTSSGSASPVARPRRSGSGKKKGESPTSPKPSLNNFGGVGGGGGGGGVLPVAAKPRSRSINADKRDNPTISTDTIQSQSSTQNISKFVSAPAVSKQKLPPPVRPKFHQQNRPTSMVVLGPGEGGVVGDHMSSVAKQLEDQLKQKAKLTVRAGEGSGGGRERGGAGGGRKESTPSAARSDSLIPNLHVTSDLDAQIFAGSKPLLNGSVAQNAAASSSSSSFSSFSSSSSSIPSIHGLKSQPYVLPESWTEHKTQEGHTYYHNSVTGKSLWTRPPSAKKSATPVSLRSESTSPFEKIAPRGWTKEINPLNLTPIYTNSRTGEKWGLTKDATDKYKYYSMANSSITLEELPILSDDSSSEVFDTPIKGWKRSLSETSPINPIYDSLAPKSSEPPNRGASKFERKMSENSLTSPTTLSPGSSRGGLTHPTGAIQSQLESLVHSLPQKHLKKHGYLQRKRLCDNMGKKSKTGWQKLYISLDNFQLKFYTDHKLVVDLEATKPLATFNLLHANISTYQKEKKLKNVFQVSSSLGEQFLLQAETSAQMNDWYSTLQSAVHRANNDYRLHPDHFADAKVCKEDDETLLKMSPTKGSHRRHMSKEMSEDDELDENQSVAEKSDRIKYRLRRLIARRPQIETLQKKGIMQDPLFGADLANLCERKKVTVPQFLIQFMEHIEAHGIDVVGLYRLSGNAASVQKLRCMVEQDQPYSLDKAEWSDINIVTGCLKLYFRELPDPLIPARSFQSFIDAAKYATTPAQRLANIAAQVKELPRPNYCTLKTLMKHLINIMDNGAVNKMHSSNLAIVFGPTLLRAEGDPFEMAKLAPIQNGIVELMLIEYDVMFSKK